MKEDEGTVCGLELGQMPSLFDNCADLPGPTEPACSMPTRKARTLVANYSRFQGPCGSLGWKPARVAMHGLRRHVELARLCQNRTGSSRPSPVPSPSVQAATACWSSAAWSWNGRWAAQWAWGCPSWHVWECLGAQELHYIPTGLLDSSTVIGGVQNSLQDGFQVDRQPGNVVAWRLFGDGVEITLRVKSRRWYMRPYTRSVSSELGVQRLKEAVVAKFARRFAVFACHQYVCACQLSPWRRPTCLHRVKSKNTSNTPLPPARPPQYFLATCALSFLRPPTSGHDGTSISPIKPRMGLSKHGPDTSLK